MERAVKDGADRIALTPYSRLSIITHIIATLERRIRNDPSHSVTTRHFFMNIFCKALLLLILTTFLVSPGRTFAQEGSSISVHNAPKDFLDFFYRHDAAEKKFDHSGAWVPASNSRIMVIFIRNQDSLDFVPAALYSPLRKVISVIDTFMYIIPRTSFKENIKSDVYVISMEQLRSKIASLKLDSPNKKLSSNSFVSCFSAGIVHSAYLVEVPDDFIKIANTCLDWTQLGN